MTVTNPKFGLLLLFAGLAMAGCKGKTVQAAVPVPQATPAPPVKPAPPTPIAVKKEELGAPSWDPQWDVYIEKALPADMLGPKAAHDVRGF